MDHKVFVGYASTLSDVSREVRSAADVIQKSGIADAVTWEATPAQGRLIIETVLAQIDQSSVCLFDITTLSPNVLFEVGYAFSKRKHVLLSVSNSQGTARQNWKSLDIFSTAGCLFYDTGAELANKFMTGFEAASQKTLWDDVAQALEAQNRASLFYAPAFQPSEADRNLRRLVNAERDIGTSVRMADPGEQGSAPLAWYVNAVYSSAATLLHMTASRGSRGAVSNARSAFLAGMAKGLQRPLLVVAEEEYDGPVDYKDLLYVYHNKKRLKEHFKTWLATAFQAVQGDSEDRETPLAAPRLELATELKHLKFGEYVAEDEEDALDDYFVRTSEYEAVLTENSVAFVGRKGVGKSANMIRASQELREDKRNLVCVVQPSTYELEGLVGILKSMDVDGSQDFLVESFWKFLLYSEIAITAIESAEKTPAGIVAGTPIAQLRDYVSQNSISEDFSIRLERAVQDALAKIPSALSESIEARRRNIIQTLHGGLVSNLRRLLGEALSERNRVAILVDNLDTAWRKNAQLNSLGILLLGLLGAANKVSDEFKRQGNKLSRVNVTMAVFLRSDIFDEVIKEAREPDKVNTRRIDWGQRSLLTRVMDERYLAVSVEGTNPSELWERYFCAEVDGRSTREYILDRILPRPRDFVFFCKAAVFNAVNARHDRIDISDIREAEKAYSKFALDALLVEYGTSIGHLEDVLYEFAGVDSIITKEHAIDSIKSATGVNKEAADEILDKLIWISFLGVEVREGEFTYPESGPALRKAKVLARKISTESGREGRLQMHPAYRNFLDSREVKG
ncbi:P-loop ATPase, Sll1717 family [Streptomyces tubercidicus]|uniref:P-loop ATPase, Sll1717 family n=1 Tax=Streptomyces tubercidicus TaxID=47759 RepID=UPI00346525AF